MPGTSVRGRPLSDGISQGSGGRLSTMKPNLVPTPRRVKERTTDDFRDETFQAINCTDIDKQRSGTRRDRHQKLEVSSTNIVMKIRRFPRDQNVDTIKCLSNHCGALWLLLITLSLNQITQRYRYTRTNMQPALKSRTS